jgi:hypothetical protein
MRQAIIKMTAEARYEDNKNPCQLARVCKEWNNVISVEKTKVGTPSWKIANGVTLKNQPIFEQLRNLKFTYSDPKSNKMAHQLEIPGDSNPFEHTFDLSKCGNAEKGGNSYGFGLYQRGIVITTSIERFFSRLEEKQDRHVILITTRFKILQQIESTAKQFDGIQDYRQGDFCIFVRWEGSKDLDIFDYLKSASTADISSKSLHDICKLMKAWWRSGVPRHWNNSHNQVSEEISKKFSFLWM